MDVIVEKFIADLEQRITHRPIILGVQGPQGSGKSYLAHQIQLSRPFAITISIDDFYHRHADLRSHTNPLMARRGVAGTHDVDLGTLVLSALRAKRPCHVPRYDKSLNGGQGDRADIGQWTQVESGVHLVVLEGWMLGYRPIDNEDLCQRYAADTEEGAELRRFELQHILGINEELGKYNVWDGYLDGMVRIETDDIGVVYEWRLEQELNRKQGMSHVQVREFVDRFMPMYALYYPQKPLFKNLLIIKIDRNRSVEMSEVVLDSYDIV
jgi:D-glycerate 3-kinase